MKVTKRNGEQVAKWLLQCDYEDFNGPIDLIAEHYIALDEVYTQRMEEIKKKNDYPDAGTLQITFLTRTLYQHLNSAAKAILQSKMALDAKHNIHSLMT